MHVLVDVQGGGNGRGIEKRYILLSLFVGGVLSVRGQVMVQYSMDIRVRASEQGARKMGKGVNFASNHSCWMDAFGGGLKSWMCCFLGCCCENEKMSAFRGDVRSGKQACNPYRVCFVCM